MDRSPDHAYDLPMSPAREAQWAWAMDAGRIMGCLHGPLWFWRDDLPGSRLIEVDDADA